MGLFDKFKSDEFKDLAKLAFQRVSLDGENIGTFIPFLLTVNEKGEDEMFACSSATNEESQDMAYEMAYDIFNQDKARLQKYAVVFVGNYEPGKDEMCPIIAECGIAQKGQAVLFAKSYKINRDGTLRKVPGVFKVRETEYALNKKKSFAARTMIEGGGDVVGPFARLPLVLTYLVAFEQGSFDGEMPNEIWEIYQNLLMGWSSRKDSIGYLMGAFSLKAVMETS